MKFKNFLYPVLIHPNQINELTEVLDLENGVKIGAAVTLTDMHHEFQKRISELPGEIFY